MPMKISAKKVCALYRSGMLTKDIRSAAGVRSDNSIYHVLHKHGITPNRANKKPPRRGKTTFERIKVSPKDVRLYTMFY